MRNNLGLVALFFGGVGMATTTACVSMASFQSADTVKKGEQRKGIGVTYNKYTVDIGDQEEEVAVPALHGWYRYGVTDKLELHSMVWVPLGATVGAKYQFLGDRDTKGLSLSAGLDIGRLTISVGEGDTKSTLDIYDIHTPLYAGYRLSSSLATYVTPRYVLRAGVGDSDTALSHLVGSAVGVALGKDSVFHLEGVALYDLTAEYSTVTAGIGFSFL